MRLRAWIPTVLALGCGAVLAGIALVWIAAWTIEPARQALEEEKTIGGFDAHLHVSVRSVRRAKPDGSIVAVLRVRNSAQERALRAGALRVEVRDADGRVYPPRGGARFPDLLPRGAQAELPFRFELPAGIRRPILWIYPDDLLTRWVPGGARSPLTPKLTFVLEPEAIRP